MKILNIGIVGFGSISKTHCIAAIAIAASDSLPAQIRIGKIYRRNRTVAAPFFSAGYAENLGELIESSDIIDICSSNAAHFSQAQQVILADRALYLEKPVGVNLREANALLSLLAAHPLVRNQVALMYRFMPGVVSLRDLVAAGEIGEIINFRCEVQHSGYLDPNRRSNWKLKKAESGGGPLLDIGVHIADMVRFTLGEAASASCHMKTVITERPDETGGEFVHVDVEDWAVAKLTLKNGMTGTMEITRVASVLEQHSRFSVYGTKGSIHFDASTPNQLRVYHQSTHLEEKGAFQTGSAFATHLRQIYPRSSLGWITDAHLASQLHFYQHILGMIPLYAETPTLLEAVRSQSVIDACYRSAEHGGEQAMLSE